jgi:NAD(P)-dependent dehydrogenase (short-subunit alcohol dehydrogenase family)
VKDLRGRVAFITGGAGGIGIGMAHAFVAAGMKVILADIDDEALARVAVEFTTPGTSVLPLHLDVTDRYAWETIVARAEAAFGPVQVLCCNAGVSGSQVPLEDIPVGSWQWTFDVNVNGTLYALRNFLPRMRARGEEGHVVVTSSILGISARPNFGTYAATKHTLVGIAETLREGLAGSRIGVSVLCPGTVRTQFAENSARLGRAVGVRVDIKPETMASIRSGIDPRDLGECVVDGIRNDRFWLFTHQDCTPEIDARFAGLFAAIEDAAAPARGGNGGDPAGA